MSHGKKVAIGHLKRCPVCGALNSKRNRECFVCRWHGDFDTNPESIDEGLGDLLKKCPELAAAMKGPEFQPKPSWLTIRFRSFLISLSAFCRKWAQKLSVVEDFEEDSSGIPEAKVKHE